jgi:hypothetical protein
VAGQRNGPLGRRFNDGEGVLVAGEGGDGVLQLEEETGDEGRLTVESDDGRGWELTKGAVGGGSGFTSGGVGVPLAVGRGQEAGERSGAHGVLVKEEKKGKKKGVGSIGDAFYRRGGRQGKEREGGSGAEFTWKRDGQREGGPSMVVSTSPWPMGAGERRMRVAQRRAGEAGSLTRGPDATVTGGVV